MCGIAGFVSGTGRMDLKSVPAVLRRLEHRGPDDKGWLKYSQDGLQTGREWSGEGDCQCDVLLLHRRLAIIDLSPSGWQPMSSKDGRYHLVYNGEIYNYLELRQELQQHGYEFQTRTDTEVLLAAFSHWGIGGLQRLAGMFSFALLDSFRRVVILARDFFGIKPMYYCSKDGVLAFASEMKALRDWEIASLRGNPERLYLYLRYGISDDGPETMLADVRQLPAGHYLEIPLRVPSDLIPVCYWTPGGGQQLDISFADAAQQLRELFFNNIRLHLRSDVPVGACLSGGIDSSSILAGMRNVAPDLELHAFGYIADDTNLSEEKWIDLAARSAKATLHKVRPCAGELQEELETLIYTQDQPFGGTNAYAQFCVFRAARDAGIKVMLDGQGADEILGGYRFYMAARLVSLLKQCRWKEALKFIVSCSRMPGVSSGWLVTKATEYLLPFWMQEPLRRCIGKELTPSWLDADWFRERNVRPRILNASETENALRENLCRTLIHNTLPGLLRYEDRNSMAFSIESRVPFLTPELVQFLLSLPEEFIIAKDGTSKAVFREAMRGPVPDSILARRDKMGFVTPEESWLRTLHRWVTRVLGSDAASSLHCLHPGKIRQQWSEILAGSRPMTPYVWRWLNLILWTERSNTQWT